MLYVSDKSGYFGKDPEIYDNRGLFYCKKGHVHFNLPKGNYSASRPLFRLNYPVKYSLPSLPTKEKNNTLPDIEQLSVVAKQDISTLFGNTKAAINVGEHRIIVTKKDLGSLLTPEISCILLHELGHYFYSTEKFCDMFAIRCMIELGYNPSQFKSFFDILGNSSESVHRKLNAFDYSKQIKHHKSQ